MARTYLSKEQHARLRQNDLYRLLRAKKGETGITGSELATCCGESKQRFKYRFDNQLLEPWELLIVFDILKVEINDLNKLSIGEGT